MRSLLPVVAASGTLLLFLGFTAGPPRPSRTAVFLEGVARDAGHGRWKPRQIALSCVCSSVAGLGVASLVSPSSVVVAFATVAAGWVPIGWLRTRARKRRLAHREVWPEAIALLTSGVRAGLSLPEVVAGLGDRGPEVLRPYFQRYRVTYLACASFPAALEKLARELADPIADRVLAALRLAHELGGTELVRVLRTLGDFVRDDLRVRKEVEARWSWTVSAARLAAAAPWLVLVGMASRPEAAAAYDSPGGTLLVMAGGVTTIVGYRLMLRAARLPEEKRWVE